MESWYSHSVAALIFVSIRLLGFFALGLGLLLVKYNHRHVTFMASRKRIMKMAQLEPSGSSCRMFAGSFSIEVGVLNAVVDIITVAEVALGDVGTKMDTKGLEGLFEVLAGWAGPITCGNYRSGVN